MILLITGVLLVILRMMLQSDEAVPAGDTVWQLTMSASVDKDQSSQALHIAAPGDSRYIRIVGQSFYHPGFQLKHIAAGNRQVRKIVATPFLREDLSYHAEYEIHISVREHLKIEASRLVTLSNEERLRYTSHGVAENLLGHEFGRTLAQLRVKSSTSQQLQDAIFSYVYRDVLIDSDAIFEGLEKTLKIKRANTLGKAQLLLALYRANNIPARLVSGIIVKEMIETEEHHWVEVIRDNAWVAYDPSLGISGVLPPNYLKLAVDSEHLAFLADGTPIEVQIDTIQLPKPAGRLGTGQKQLLDVLDLNRLSPDVRFMLATLLLLPIGALLTTIFRKMVGVVTYGAFTPSLIAMAIMHAEWLTAVVVSTIAVAIGVVGRSVLTGKLSRIPRLSVVLTIVAFAMVMGISVMDYFDLNPDPQVILLPIIVLSALVDRFYSAVDEHGPATAIYRLGWTIAITMICVAIFSLEVLQQLVLTYPEAQIFVLLGILLTGKYEGVTLTKHPAFLWMSEPRSRKSVSPPESQPQQDSVNKEKQDGGV